MTPKGSFKIGEHTVTWEFLPQEWKQRVNKMGLVNQVICILRCPDAGFAQVLYADVEIPEECAPFLCGKRGGGAMSLRSQLLAKVQELYEKHRRYVLSPGAVPNDPLWNAGYERALDDCVRILMAPDCLFDAPRVVATVPPRTYETWQDGKASSCSHPACCHCTCDDLACRALLQFNACGGHDHYAYAPCPNAVRKEVHA